MQAHDEHDEHESPAVSMTDLHANAHSVPLCCKTDVFSTVLVAFSGFMDSLFQTSVPVLLFLV